MNTRDLIIATAYKMFQKEGYDSVTVSDICEECGITKPTFYRYIESKDHLLSYFYEGVTTELPGQLVQMLTSEHYWEQICMGFDTILMRSQDFGPDLYSQLFISNLRDNKGTFDFNDTLTQAMTALFAKAQQSGQIKNPSEPSELYMACAHMCFGYGILWCLNHGENNLLEDFHTALENVCIVDEKYRIRK